jgi:hypothetical protein
MTIFSYQSAVLLPSSPKIVRSILRTRIRARLVAIQRVDHTLASISQFHEDQGQRRSDRPVRSIAVQAKFCSLSIVMTAG